MPVLACCGLCWLEVFFWTFHTQPSSVWHKHTRNESASQCNISRSRRNVIHDSIISEFHIMSHNLSWFYNLLIYSTYTCIYIYTYFVLYMIQWYILLNHHQLSTCFFRINPNHQASYRTPCLATLLSCLTLRWPTGATPCCQVAWASATRCPGNEETILDGGKLRLQILSWYAFFWITCVFVCILHYFTILI